MNRLPILLLLLVALEPLAAQDASNCTLLDIEGGRCKAVATLGDLTLFGNGAVLVVCDSSNPADLVEIGALVTPGNISKLVLRDSLACMIAITDGYYAVDFRDPRSPVLVGSHPFDYPVDDLSIDGDRAYITAREEGVRVLDIGDPAAPQELEPYGNGTWINTAAARDGILYAHGDYGISIVDVHDNGGMFLVGYAPLSTISSDLYLAGDLLFLSLYYSGIRIYDIGDPASPVLVTTIEAGVTNQGCQVQGDILYCAGDGLAIYDLSTITQPLLLGRHRAPSSAYDLCLRGEDVFLVDYDTGLYSFDVSDPWIPRELCHRESLGQVMALAASGDLLCLIGGFNLHTVGLSDPEDITLLSHTRLVYGTAVAFDGRICCVADQGMGIRIFDMLDPRLPVELGLFPYTGWIRDMELRDRTLFAAHMTTGMFALDIADPANPVLLGQLIDGYGNNSLALAGDMAYLASDGLDVPLRGINISDPANMFIQISYPLDSVKDLVVDGCTAWVGTAWGLYALDLSDPQQITLLGSFDTDGWASGVAVSDQRAYVANDSRGLRVIDVSVLSDMVEVGYFVTPGYTTGVLARGPLAIVDDGSCGLLTIRCENQAVPPVIRLEIHRRANGVLLSWNGAGGRSWDVHRLSAPWEPLSLDNLLATTESPAWFDIGALSFPSRFYRVVAREDGCGSVPEEPAAHTP